MDTVKETINHTPVSHEISGTYGDGIIKVNTFKLPENNRVTVNIHGTFGRMNGGNDKYRLFAESLVENKASNVVLYESSRKDVEIDPTITDRYKQKQAKFIGKTFSDELEDARRVLRDIVENSESRFGIKKEDLQLTLNGNSLGGILAFYLADEFPEVKNIVSVGTGLRLEIKDVPILDTFPEPEELRAKLSNYQGKYLMIYGTEDDVFTEQGFFDLINTVGVSDENKSSVRLIGVDHTFGKINDEESLLPYKRVVSDATSLVRDNMLVSGGENMQSSLLIEKSGIRKTVDRVLKGGPWVPDDNPDELFFG